MFQTGPVRVSAVSVATDQTTIHHPYMVSTAPSTGSIRAVNEILGKVSQYSEMAPSPLLVEKTLMLSGHFNMLVFKDEDQNLKFLGGAYLNIEKKTFAKFLCQLWTVVCTVSSLDVQWSPRLHTQREPVGGNYCHFAVLPREMARVCSPCPCPTRADTRHKHRARTH